jgi:hypothetical protein
LKDIAIFFTMGDNFLKVVDFVCHGGKDKKREGMV